MKESSNGNGEIGHPGIEDHERGPDGGGIQENELLIKEDYDNILAQLSKDREKNVSNEIMNDMNADDQSHNLESFLGDYSTLIADSYGKSQKQPSLNSEYGRCTECDKTGSDCNKKEGDVKCANCQEKNVACSLEQSSNVENNSLDAVASRKRSFDSEKPVMEQPRKSKKYDEMSSGRDSNKNSPHQSVLNNIRKTNMSRQDSPAYPTQQQSPGSFQPRMSPEPPMQYPRSSFYLGATSVYDTRLINCIQLDSIDQIQLSSTVALRRVAPNVQFMLKDDYNQEVYLKQEQEVDMVESLIYPHGKTLVKMFFKLVHPYYPILHERVFLEKYSRSYRELTAPLLASIYSLALQWWDFHPGFIGFPKPDVIEKLNTIAFETFLNRIERPKLSMVQTGLLLLLCRSENTNNWVISSCLVALAEELGLGIECQDWRLPKWEKDLRKRLAWAVWSQDKWTALLESRHSHLILGRNWMVQMLSESDLPTDSPIIKERSNSETSMDMNMGAPMFQLTPNLQDFKNGALIFQNYVSLSIILGEIMDTFYTLGSMHINTSIEQVLRLAKPLQLKLREWYHQLPPQLSMATFESKKFNCNATLTLCYFIVEISLHRKIISSLTPTTPAEIKKVCRTAARTRLVAAIEFIRDLKTEHTNAFWFPSATGSIMLIGSFAALLYTSAESKEESKYLSDIVRHYIWILRVGSKTFDKFGHALSRMHALFAEIPGLLTDEVKEDSQRQSQKRNSKVSQGSPTASSRGFNSATNSPWQYVSPGIVNHQPNTVNSQQSKTSKQSNEYSGSFTNRSPTNSDTFLNSDVGSNHNFNLSP
ncbi:Transcriptional activator protein DAL81 [Nakaseomyces bracarensis]|uniref:Transcriptional activator protein DAL81 n=1 Tax=Nakaseomyces bracarensis TaxID=273131 RepID=A0ABR4NVW0_9SACH